MKTVSSFWHFIVVKFLFNGCVEYTLDKTKRLLRMSPVEVLYMKCLYMWRELLNAFLPMWPFYIDFFCMIQLSRLKQQKHIRNLFNVCILLCVESHKEHSLDAQQKIAFSQIQIRCGRNFSFYFFGL